MKLMDEILNVARTEHATNHLEIQPPAGAGVAESLRFDPPAGGK